MSSSYSSAKELPNLRIPLKEIQKATKEFADKYLIKKGGTAYLYKAKLSRVGRGRIYVAVQRVLPDYVVSRDDFLEEIKALSGLNKDKKNIISVLRFCYEKGENIVVMEYADNSSLEQHLSNPALNWSRRLKICLDVTRGILESSGITLINKYLENIRCCNILLYKDWKAKISCFGRPKNNKYGNMMIGNYPLGLIFLQVLEGKKGAGGDKFEAAMVEHSFVKEKLDEFIHPTLREQIHPLSFTIFLQTAYEYCLRSTSDHLDKIADRLEDALEVQLRHEHIENNMAHLKIRLNDIEGATEFFSQRYLIDSDSCGNFYKAELGPLDIKSLLTKYGYGVSELFKRKITVAIQRISYDKVRRERRFFDGFKMHTCYEHSNIVPLLGFSWEGSDVILVFEYPLKGSLRDYLGKANSLTWKQRVRISLDIARGWDHIRMRDNLVGPIHEDLSSASIFLDDKWTAKIVCSKLCKSSSNGSKNRIEKNAYIYSFGVLLFEILFGRLADDAIDTAEKAKGLEHIPQSLLDEQTQWEMVDQHFLDAFSKIPCEPCEMVNQTFLDAFSNLAYQCLGVAETQVIHRTMESIIKELEGLALPFETPLPEHLQRLVWLKIAHSDIESVINGLNENDLIGSGGYGEVYKAEIDVFDNNHSLEIKSMNKYQLPRKKRTVAIKRIISRKDEQGRLGFCTEIEVLSKCKHDNIVSLFGYSDQNSEMILVYEFLANGSLDAYLRRRKNENNFTWSQRLKVCVDIANGIQYLHSTLENKEMIIHRDIKSANILLGDNLKAKIADFGVSKVCSTNQSKSTRIVGTDVYMDPAYQDRYMLTKESDIYSFGVVMFEVLSGKLAYDDTYMSKNRKGLAPIARKHSKEGTLKKMVDPGIMKEANQVISILKIGPSQNSLDTFLAIARECLKKDPHERPTIQDIIKKLRKALKYQENHIKIIKLSLEDINKSTENFSNKKCIMIGEFWKVYSGEIQNDGQSKSVFIKQLRKSSPKDVFLTELEIIYKHKHKNVIDVVGYCEENDEKIIVYEHAYNGYLSAHLKKESLGWMERLKICIDVASGLQFLH